MSQDNIERILGRLITDRNFYDSCSNSLEIACQEKGLLLTDWELAALNKLEFDQLDPIAESLNNRLKRAGTKRNKSSSIQQ